MLGDLVVGEVFDGTVAANEALRGCAPSCAGREGHHPHVPLRVGFRRTALCCESRIRPAPREPAFHAAPPPSKGAAAAGGGEKLTPKLAQRLQYSGSMTRASGMKKKRAVGAGTHASVTTTACSAAS